MRLIQAKVSEEQFKAFSHYLVDGDLTVAGAIVGWIEEHCGVAEGAPKTPKVNLKPASPAQVVVEVPKPYDTVQSALNRPVLERGASAEPASEFLCKICGKPTNGEYLCKNCKKQNSIR